MDMPKLFKCSVSDLFIGFFQCLINSLVDHGAELNVKTVNNETPLHFAARKGKNDCVRILLNSGAKVKFYFIRTINNYRYNSGKLSNA